MPKHLLIVDEEAVQEPNKGRAPLGEELQEVLNGVLVLLIEHNQGGQNLVEFLEARLIQLALEQALHNKSRAARRLGVQRKRLERRARKYHLATPWSPSEPAAPSAQNPEKEGA